MTAQQIRNPDGSLFSQSDTRTLQEAKDRKKLDLEDACRSGMEGQVVAWDQYLLSCEVILEPERTNKINLMAPFHVQLDDLKADVDACSTVEEVDAIIWSDP